MNVDLKKFRHVKLRPGPNHEWIGLHFDGGGEALRLQTGMSPRAVASELRHVAERLDRRDAITDATTLRKLRVYHWKQALLASRQQRSGLPSKASLTRAQNNWNLHMGAVQCLNDFLPDTTAGQDMLDGVDE